MVVVDASLRGGPLQAYVAQMADGGVVVSYRGTEGKSLPDWLLDFEFFYKNVSYPGCEGCELHEGFYGSYLALQPGIAEVLDLYGAASAPYVWVTGHSLGAAMAEIAAFALVSQGYPVAAAYTFGTPRVGNPAWATAYAAAVIAGAGVANFRVIHDKDAVPHLPPQWLPGSSSGGAQAPTSGFRHPPTEVWYNNISSSFKVCSGSNGEDPTCSDSLLLPDGFKEHDTYINTSMTCGNAVEL